MNGKLSVPLSDSRTAIAQQRQSLRGQRMQSKMVPSEIDMVINNWRCEDGRFDVVEDEIRQIHEACNGHILKVLSKPALLTEEIVRCVKS